MSFLTENNEREETGEEIQIVSQGAIESIERAQVDIQISTAKRYPRPVKSETIRQQIMLHACVDEETARECYYVLPRGGGTLDGPSVRLSEIVAAAYKNLHVAGRIIDHDSVHRTVTAQAVAWDLESNVRRTAEWSEPITMRSSDAVKVTSLAAISKAERNAIFKTVPKAIWSPVVQRCIEIAKGNVETLASRRSKMVKAFSAWGIVQEQILSVFGYESLEQITLEDFSKLQGFYTAIKEGVANIDEIFRPIAKKTTEPLEPKTDPANVPAAPAEETTRRRGRPPGSTNKPKDEPKKEEVNETPKTDKPEESPKEQHLEEKTEDAPSPVSTVVLIRHELERTGKSEQRLLAVLNTWKLTTSMATPLDEIPADTLEMVWKRWATVEKSL
jgi:hypothetical protein